MNEPAVTKDVVIEPVGTATQGTQSIVPKMPAELAIARSLGPSAGSTPVRAVTNIMCLLIVSQTGLSMPPGPIATDFQRPQGFSQSPASPIGRVRLFYCGCNHLDICVSAARDVRHEVILPWLLQPLQLADLPRNEWETITYLWYSSSGPQTQSFLPLFMFTSEATANALPAPMDDKANLSVPVPHEDTNMADSGVTTVSASLVTLQSATANRWSSILMEEDVRVHGHMGLL